MSAYDCALTVYGFCVLAITVYFVYVAWKGFKNAK